MVKHTTRFPFFVHKYIFSFFFLTGEIIEFATSFWVYNYLFCIFNSDCVTLFRITSVGRSTNNTRPDHLQTLTIEMKKKKLKYVRTYILLALWWDNEIVISISSEREREKKKISKQIFLFVLLSFVENPRPSATLRSRGKIKEIGSQDFHLSLRLTE